VYHATSYKTVTKMISAFWLLNKYSEVAEDKTRFSFPGSRDVALGSGRGDLDTPRRSGTSKSDLN